MTRHQPDVFTLWPDGFAVMLSLETVVSQAELDPRLVELIKLRCSELNDCSYCTRLHHARASELGVDETTLSELTNWSASEQFSEAERAALALTDMLTAPGSGDLTHAVNLARSHFSQTHIAQLVYTIATINAWNRLATIQI